MVVGMIEVCGVESAGSGDMAGTVAGMDEIYGDS